jgi:hypothetical protein
MTGISVAVLIVLIIPRFPEGEKLRLFSSEPFCNVIPIYNDWGNNECGEKNKDSKRQSGFFWLHDLIIPGVFESEKTGHNCD